MHNLVIQLSMAIMMIPLLVLGVACFDPVWCRKIVSVIGSSLGKIWKAGAIVAALMVVVGIEFGVLQAFARPINFD